MLNGGRNEGIICPKAKGTKQIMRSSQMIWMSEMGEYKIMWVVETSVNYFPKRDLF